MEETKTMTAERSLEIIGEVMEQNRSRATEFLRRWLLVAGRTTIGVAVLLGVVGVCLGMTLNLPWLFIPVIMYFVMRRVERNAPQNSLGVVGTWVKEVWITFILMVFILGFLSSVGNHLLIYYSDDPASVAPVLIDDIKLLWPLLGMAVCVTGFLLHRKLVVVCGLFVGVLGFLFYHFGVLGRLCLFYLSVDLQFMGTVWHPLQEPFAFVIFALVGMILPAMLLKSESK